jgi:hypothetical protein
LIYSIRRRGCRCLQSNAGIIIDFVTSFWQQNNTKITGTKEIKMVPIAGENHLARSKSKTDGN